jgi:uncharacterized protein (TIGR04222 family)
MNVLDLRGPEFLEFYIFLLGCATLGATILRWVLRSPGGEVSHLKSELDPFETAYLAGGPKMAVDAALTSLVHSSALSLSAGGSRFKVNAPPAGRRSPLEKAVFNRIAYGESAASDLHRAAVELTESMANRLCQSNLALTPNQVKTVRIVPAFLVGLVFVLGIVKTGVGISRNKPVFLLILLCLIAILITSWFAFKVIHRSRAGDRLLNRLRDRNVALHTAVKSAPERMACNDVAFALALFGPTILTTGALLRLRYVLWPVRQSGDGGWGGSSCGGGGGCGGGGCGGGGGGGGGCGGCGGG